MIAAKVFSLLAFLGMGAVAFCPRPIYAQPMDLQTGPATGGAADTNAYKVSSFTIKGRNVGSFALPLKVGERWTPEKQFEVLEAIRDAFANDALQARLFSQQGD